MARENSLIFPRSTVTTKGAYSLPLTSMFTRIAIGLRSPRRRGSARPARSFPRGGLRGGALQEAGEVGHHEALVAAFRDLLHLVPGLHLEEAALAVGLLQNRAGPHAHARPPVGPVADVHRRAHAGRAP